MAVSTQSELELQGSAGVSPNGADAVGVGQAPCGHGARPTEVSPYGVAYLPANPAITCGFCGLADRPLWWGVCGWCGAEEEDFDAQ